MSVKTNEPILHNRAKITKTIANFWNKTSDGWRQIWGPHIHHGYYPKNQSLSPLQAQEKLIDKLIELFDIKAGDKILDVGCGMGGSSIHLAKKFNVNVTGITLSSKQVDIATDIAKKDCVKNVSFKIEDALSLRTLKDNSFDVIWSLESCEQFCDKNLFLQQAYRVLKPGGTLILATWCSDSETYEGKQEKQYTKLCHEFDLPYMPTMNYYQNLLTSNKFHVNLTQDWTLFVEQSWDIGLSQLKKYSFFALLKLGGLRGWRFARQVKLMRNAFRDKRIKYGVFLATK